MSDFEKQLDAEIDAVRLDLATNPDPRVQKLRALEAARALYGMPHPHQAEDASNGATRPAPRTVVRKVDPNREPLFSAVYDYLKRATAPVKTAEIFTYLEMLDIAVGGTEPKSNLSAILHNSKRYKSYGRKGWMLPENAKVYDALPSAVQPLLEEGAEV